MIGLIILVCCFGFAALLWCVCFVGGRYEKNEPPEDFKGIDKEDK